MEEREEERERGGEREREKHTLTHTNLIYQLSIFLCRGVPAVIQNEDIWF